MFLVTNFNIKNRRGQRELNFYAISREPLKLKKCFTPHLKAKNFSFLDSERNFGTIIIKLREFSVWPLHNCPIFLALQNSGHRKKAFNSFSLKHHFLTSFWSH